MPMKTTENSMNLYRTNLVGFFICVTAIVIELIGGVNWPSTVAICALAGMGIVISHFGTRQN